MKREASAWLSFILFLILLLGSSCSKQISFTSLPVLSTSTSTAEPVSIPTLTINPTNTRSPQTETPNPTLVSTSTPVTHPRDLQISFFAVSDEMIPIPGYNNTYKNNTSLYLMNLDGSNLVEVLDKAYSDTAEYVWSPDGRQVAYVTLEDYFDTLYSVDLVYSLYDLETHALLKLPSVRLPVWHASGKAIIMVASEGWLSPSSLLMMDNLSGSVLAELPYSQISPLLTYEDICIAPDGETLAIFTGGAMNQTAIHLLKAEVKWDSELQKITGRFEPQETIPFKILEIPNAFIKSCTWSPDGSKLAFMTNWGDGRVANYVYNFKTRSLVKLTLNVWDYQWMPAWSPDGQSLAYLEMRNGSSYIVVIQADGTGRIKIQPDSNKNSNRSFAWTPDGSHLIVGEGSGYMGAGSAGLVLYRRDGTRVVALQLPEGEGFKNFAFRPGSGFTGPWPEKLILP